MEFDEKCGMFRELCIWLHKNTEKFNEEEKNTIINQYEEYTENFGQANVISDELYDFFSSLGIVEPRHISFTNKIVNNFPKQRYRYVLDVGAGRTCKLSRSLREEGYIVTSMDPDIRLTQEEIDAYHIRARKEKFLCDDYAKWNEASTSLRKFDLIVGLEPCEATEHIIRQCEKYNKPYIIAPCATTHNSLEGETFQTSEQWYDYLSQISEGTSVTQTKDESVIIMNQMEMDL